MEDRTYYRALSPSKLLLVAREEGINPEMAVAIADALADDSFAEARPGQFHFNPTYLKETAR